MNDQLTSQLSNTTLKILDQLRNWSNLTALKPENLPTEDLPTARQVADLRNEIDGLRAEDSQRAEEFSLKLYQIEQKLIQRFRDRINSGLAELASATPAATSWESTHSQIERMVTEVEALTGVEEKETRRRTDEQKTRLKSETIRLEAAQHFAREKDKILANEREGAYVNLVLDSKNLMAKMGQYGDNAEDLLPEVRKELEKSVEESSSFYENIRFRYEGPMTADADQEFDDALADLEKIKKLEGDDALVLYPSSADAPKGDVSQMTVAKAIPICRQRRQKFLDGRANSHIEKIKNHLEEGNPREAEREWSQISDADHLSEMMKKVVEEQRQRITSDLTKLGRFEEQIKAAESRQPSIDAWADLMEAGRNSEFERFLAESELWSEAKKKLGARVGNDVFEELRRAMTHLGNDNLAAFQQELDRVDQPLLKWKEDFSDARKVIARLREWSEKLAASLAQMREELDRKTPQFETVAKILQVVNVAFEKTRDDLPKSIAERFVLPPEYQRLKDDLDAYQKADVLLSRLRARAEASDITTTGLKQLVEEIRGHEEQRVAPKYKEDYRRLGEFAEARYNYLVGEAILEIAGDPEEAETYLAAAAKHPKFASKANEGIGRIKSILTPAKQRVSDALAQADQCVRQGQFWEAYQRASAVSTEPAPKELRDDLHAKIPRYRQSAFEESDGFLTQAVNSGQGDPDLLERHKTRLKTLDSRRYAEIEAQLDLLIYEMKAEVAIKNGHWNDAEENYGKVAEEIRRRGGNPGRSQQFQERAKGVKKEGLLQLQIMLEGSQLEASQVVQELKMSVSGIFADDPDLRSALALALLFNASEAEEAFGETPDDQGGTNELELLKKVRNLLQDARKQSDPALSLAKQWLIRRPAYEQARCLILGCSEAEVATSRVTLIQQRGQDIKAAERISRQKLEIVKLLSSLPLLR